MFFFVHLAFTIKCLQSDWFGCDILLKLQITLKHKNVAAQFLKKNTLKQFQLQFDPNYKCPDIIPTFKTFQHSLHYVAFVTSLYNVVYKTCTACIIVAAEVLPDVFHVFTHTF